MSKSIEALYQKLCLTTLDINEHLPILRRYSEAVDHVIEFGVREGNSTVALACGRPKSLTSYDINEMPKGLKPILSEVTDFRFIQQCVLSIDIEETDLLFIDTYHSFGQLQAELALHASKVRKFIISHDTFTFGSMGEDGKQPGLTEAIGEFIAPGLWKKAEEFKNNNGLIVLERRGLK